MSVTATAGYRPSAGVAGGRRSALSVLAGLGRGLHARASVSNAAKVLIDLAGLGGITYGAYLWSHAAGFVVGGFAALIFGATLSK